MKHTQHKYTISQSNLRAYVWHFCEDVKIKDDRVHCKSGQVAAGAAANAVGEDGLSISTVTGDDPFARGMELTCKL